MKFLVTENIEYKERVVSYRSLGAFGFGSNISKHQKHFMCVCVCVCKSSKKNKRTYLGFYSFYKGAYQAKQHIQHAGDICLCFFLLLLYNLFFVEHTTDESNGQRNERDRKKKSHRSVVEWNSMSVVYVYYSGGGRVRQLAAHEWPMSSGREGVRTYKGVYACCREESPTPATNAAHPRRRHLTAVSRLWAKHQHSKQEREPQSRTHTHTHTHVTLYIESAQLYITPPPPPPPPGPGAPAEEWNGGKKKGEREINIWIGTATLYNSILEIF